MISYRVILVALISTASVGLAQAPRAATITGKIHNPPAREIEFGYQSSLSPTRSEHLVVLDSENRFALTFPVPRGTLVIGRYEDPQPPKWKWLEGLRSFVFGPRAQLILFVEPGDSLHIEMNEGHFSSSLEFSGQGADNNRFIAEILPDYFAFRLDYEGLALEDFIRQMEQRRQNEFEWLAKGREKYALSAGFIDYATARFNYEWANGMISYPTEYRFANGRDNRDITPEYYDFLQDIPLVDEKAIGTGEYSTFLERTLDRESGKEKPKPLTLSDMYDFSGLELSDAAQTQLDSLYEKDGRKPSLSKMVDLSALGLSDSEQTQLDSLCASRRSLRLSEIFDLSKFELSDAAQAQIDAFYQRSDQSFGITRSRIVENRRWVCPIRNRPNSTPCAQVAARSGCPKYSICRNSSYRTPLKPRSTPSTRDRINPLALPVQANTTRLALIRWAQEWCFTCQWKKSLRVWADHLSYLSYPSGRS